MSSSKCGKCGLVNQPTDSFCRRCQSEINISRPRGPVTGPRHAARVSSPIWSLLALTVIGAAVWYVYQGMQKSVAQVGANDQQRIASQAKTNTQGLSRSDYDRQRAGQYGNAIQSSPGINASQSHTEQINQLTKRPTANK